MNAPASLALRAELTRKALHLGTAVVPIAWGLGWVDRDVLQIAASVALGVALLVELLRRHWAAGTQAFDRSVGALLRPHERRGLTGATWLALAMTAVLWSAPAAAGVAALWAAAVGDASAAIVGRAVAARRREATAGKSFAGSFAAALSTALGCLWLTPATFGTAAALGVVAALAERPHGPGDDNLRVAAAVALAAVVLGLR